MAVKHSVKRSNAAVKHFVKHSRSGCGIGFSGAFAKDMLRCWAHGWKRFVSIAVISMLGVAVLTGIYAGCRDMFRAADRFYDAQRLHDIQVLSTYGLTDGDVSALKRVEGVETVQPERTQSVTTDIKGSSKSVTMTELGVEGLDMPYVQDGEMPDEAGEVAVTEKFLVDSGLSIGDHLVVAPEEDNDEVVDSAADATSKDGEGAGEVAPSFPTELTVTAQVLDPKDLTNPTGYSTAAFRSPTTADYVFFAPSDGVAGNVYTAISIALDNAVDLDAFSDAYDAEVNEVVERIEKSVQNDRQSARRATIVDAARKRLDAAQADARKRLDDAQTQLDAQRAQYERQLAQFGASEEPARSALIGANPQLTQAQQQLNDAQTQLDAQRKSVENEFADQQRNIDDIGDAQWYVQTRASIGGISSLESDVSSIESIGRAFPVVFLLVAVLMSLTTMTRMVEEERGLIGTYTGLGYGGLAIASRYVLFAVLASLIGGSLGLLLGFLGIPAFLLLVLKNMYVIPDIRLEYDWLTGSAGIVLFVVGILIATTVACAGELKQTPAELMRPKAPKAGSRVLLERITPIWRRLSFLNKVTVRNIFRFKSRLLMTVGGVAGCTALIVCGLAINDSVDTLAVKQYDDIYRYDLMLVASDEDADQMRERVTSEGNTERTMDLRIESGELESAEGSETIQLMIVPENGEDDLAAMISLRDVAGSHGTVTLGDNGVIVAQSAAKALGVEAGDTVALTDGQMRHGEARVAAVSRNLIGSDVYISSAQYDKVFGNETPIVLNGMLATLRGSADENIDYADELARDPHVLSAVSCDDMQRSFTFDLMGAVVGLIVALAGSLALVVLFTLSNTNVSERVREIATLKVLGFFDREVHAYVNKEMMILTVMGIVIGLPLGRWIGGLLTAVLDMPSIYFEVEVRWWSYLIAAGVTLAFALLVQLFVNPVLDRIDPVSSLKSVE